MTRRVHVGLGLLVAVLFVAEPIHGQDVPEDQTGAINLFFDCQARNRACFDLDYFRREIPVVNWVRDREVSDVHVLVTSEETGGGGRLFTLAFIGLGDFEDLSQVLTGGTAGDATLDEERGVLAGRLKLGLIPYIAGTALADEIEIDFGATDEGADGSDAASPDDGEVNDPWNFWVFQLGGNSFLFGESSFSEASYTANASANRTTEAWKFNLSGRYNRRTQEFDVSDDETVTSLVEDWRTSSLLVRSLSPQWSLGVRTDAGRSTRVNEDFRWSVAPGIEYNFVPYSESTRRAVTLQAVVNVNHWDYAEVTIYGEEAETRIAPSLTLTVNQIQPWGRVNASVTALQYLHDSALRRASVSGNAEFRLFRGFSLNIFGDYSWIRDQLFLPAGDISTEEILLRQRSLETSFTYFTSFGIRYRFGSIFNNVVNPRFGR